jgi:PKD repeat protein
MKGNRHKLATIAVVVALVLTAFFVMATPVSRNEVIACAGNNQVVDVGETVQFDGSCSKGVGALMYKWYFGDGNVGSGPRPQHTYQGSTPGSSGNEEGIYYATLVVKDGNDVYDLDTVRISVRNAYPIADAGLDKTVDEDETVFFDAFGSSDINDDIVLANWNFGDGSEKNANLQAVVQHVYEKAGIYPVTLTLTDNDGAIGKDNIFVTVKNIVPSADGLGNGDSDDDLIIYEDDTVTFDASLSTDTPFDIPLLEYGWDFGDGSKAEGIGTTHTYTKQGTYLATLTVKDDDDASAQDTITIHVLNAPPMADASSDQTVEEGDTVFFDATDSSDTLSDRPILDYSWSFGDIGTLPTNNWYDDSVNEIDLTVKDDEGFLDMDSMSVTVNNVPPVASIDGVYVLVDFTIRASGEKWHNVIVTISEPNLDTPVVEVLRTPGSPNDQAETVEDVHINIAEDVIATVYYTPLDDPVNGSPNGATPVWFTMAFEDGTSHTQFKSFNVQKPGEWVWAHDMNPYIKGQPLHFQGSVYDPGTDDIQVTWDFGDGSSPVINNYNSNGNHPIRISEHNIHTFPYGTYTVKLDAVDDDGGFGAMSVTVTNTDLLKCTNIAPRASSSGGRTVDEDESFTIEGFGEDTSSDQSILTYTWDLGDGTIAYSPTITHTYAKSGTYYPTLVVVDDEGAIGITSELVEVVNVIPTAIAKADRLSIPEDDVINFEASSSSDTPTDLPLLQYAWDYGDGSKGVGIATSHVYSKMGTYQVVLTIMDDNGAVDASELTIEVQNLAPADIEINPVDTADQDEVVFFMGRVEETPSDIALLEYLWDFDDGSTGTGRNPTHAFTSPGHYSVSLKVTDDDAAYSEEIIHISVRNVRPFAYGGLSKYLYGPQMMVTFDGRVFDTLSDQSTLQYYWDLGDGTTSSSLYTTHTYPTITSETYTAYLKVKDVHGATDTFFVTVNVMVDSDGDQLLDGDELDLGLDPFNYDTDGDWLIDYYELNPPGIKPSTDPAKADEDNDGCSDWEEIWPGRDGYITDPFDPDMDGDGLKDCEEVFAKTYKSTKRFRIGDIVNVPLYGVRSSSPTPQIITAEAKVGISHKNVGDLKITLKNDIRSIVLRDREGSSADNIFLSYDIFSLGFLASDFNTSWKWTLIVDDQVSYSYGFVEYFEIYIMMATNPTNADTDFDGLHDLEEVTLGNDGWLTDPWKRDTDYDGISDSLETNGWEWYDFNKNVDHNENGFKTDPTRKDTDRDGVEDKDDWDPLNNLMVEVDIGIFIPYDEDGDGIDNDIEVFLGISVGIEDPDEDEMLWTDRQSVEYYGAMGEAKDLNRQYTFEVNDKYRWPKVVIFAYDDDDPGGDDVLDFVKGKANGWGRDYDIIQGSPNDHNDDSICYHSNGLADGYDDEWDVWLEWCIRTIRPERINTLLLDSTNSDSLFEHPDDQIMRYHGEQEFYLALLDVPSTTFGSAFVPGHNAVIIPRTVFTNSSLYTKLESENPPPCINDLDFSANDDSSTWTSGSIVGSINGTAKGQDADNLLWHLTHDENSNEIAKIRTVSSHQTQLVTLNLETFLLNLIPFKAVEFDNTGRAPSGFTEKLWEIFVSFVEFIGGFMVAMLNFAARFVKAIIDIGLWVFKKIIDFISVVAEAIKSIAEVILDFTEGLVVWVVDLIADEILPIIKDIVMFTLKTFGGPVFERLGEALFDSLDYILTWIAEDFVPGVFDIVKGALNLPGGLIKVMKGFAACIGDVTSLAVGDNVKEVCGEIVNALKELGENLVDIFKEALMLGGTILLTAITIVLDLCGALSGTRDLTDEEFDEAIKIFGTSIDLSEVEIADATPCTDFVAWVQGLNDDKEKRPFVTGYVITVTDTK